MKTIAVNEAAYRRLAVWKQGKKDTFSKVIERMVPKKGTFDAALEAVKALPDWDANDSGALEDAVEEGRKPLADSWK